ncbi:unnamed protein product [Diamesa serratosioi]
MNQDSLTFTLTQISYLVFNLNKKNFQQSSREISELCKQFGLEAERHLLRCLFSSIDFADSQNSYKNSLQAKLLSSELSSILNRSSFVSSLCFALENPFAQQKTLRPTQNLINQISRSLNCSQIQESALGIALKSSLNTDLSKYAEYHLKICLPNLIQSYIELDTLRPNQEGTLTDISPELLQLLLSLISYGKHTNFNLTDIVYSKFLKKLCRDFPRDHVPLILTPLLYSEESEITTENILSNSQTILKSTIMDTSWSNIVSEIGYSFTSSVEDCKSHLMKGGGRDISALDVSKVISLMCRTHTNLSDSSINLPTPNAFWPNSSQANDPNSATSGQSKDKLTIDNGSWKPEVFIQALKEVVPNLNWKEVCLGLDHADFVIKDRVGLNLLITTIRLGMQTYGISQNCLAECIYRHWTNVEGQLSLLAAILKSPDIYSFADNIYSSVPVELLKTPPEADNKDVASWKSMHLVEVLLYIADNGYYNQVLEILKFPLQHCPDILFMGLLQINPPVTVLRQELFTSLVPVFLSNHPNSGPILHHAWNSLNFGHSLKNIIMLSMSEWYLRGDTDQSRLSRILDVAQDLKALSNLLNSRTFMFVIDLACLASRREYLKLEKWLTDKLRDHGDQFAGAIIKFLQRRCPQIMGKIPDDQLAKTTQLQPETLNTITHCLQSFIPNIHSPEIAESAVQITANCNLLLNKRRFQAPMLRGSSHLGMESSFSNTNQAFPPSMNLVDLSSNMGSMNLNSGNPNSNANFNFNVLNSLVSTPASPSRLLSGLGGQSSNSPFAMTMPSNAQQQLGGGLGRIGATPTGDKQNILNPLPNQGSQAQQSLFPESPAISKEIEDEANGYFQRIYNHPPHPTLSIDEVLEMLQRFQESTIPREREVHHCMLRNLLEEYKFFPQYPEKELQITAQLFGGMIERSLVTTYLTLGLALRCVLDALRKPEGSKMYYFGVTALDRFKSKLHQYQKYCEHVRSIQHFNQFPQHLIDYIEYGIRGIEPPNKPQGPIPTGSSTAATDPSGQLLPNALSHLPMTSTQSSLYRSNSVTGSIVTQAKPVVPATPPTTSAPTSSGLAPQTRMKSIANATNIDTLLVANETELEKIQAPPDSVQDKTAFIFNNLSQLNLTSKCEEIKEILIKEYYPWMSQYLVLKRASIEINFHTLYSNFLDALKMHELLILTTNETFRNIKVLLRSDKSIANFSDRSLLKNLGHWLGMLTLGRNRPILHAEIDLKSLVLEAYNKGQQELLYVVPFVAKVIESTAKSKVFKPPNPWTMAIMNVLAELHQEPDLKLNLKFEIEVLCKNLNIDVADLKPAYYLKDPERSAKIIHQLSPPSKSKESLIQQSIAAAAADEAAGANSASPANSGNEAFATGPTDPRYSYLDISLQNFSPCINQQMVLSTSLVLLHTHPQLKAIVRGALEKTIQDWVVPVVDRSIKISLKTTEAIIRKDFALDPDDQVMRSAAQYMSRNLAAGMAMITCKDQLMTAIQSNVKNAFATILAPQQKDQIDMAAATIATDNVELVCAFIQKSAIEKCMPDLDKQLSTDYDMRKLSRQEGRPYCDPQALTYQAERMPAQIRLKVGSISPSQLSVYEEFGRNVPGFQRLNDRDLFAIGASNGIPMPNINTSQFGAFANDEIGSLYDDVATKIEAFIGMCSSVPVLTVQNNNMHSLMECLLVTRRSRDNTSAVNLLKKAVEGLMEGLINIPEYSDQIKIYRDIHLRVLRLLQDARAFGSTWTNKAIARYMIECPEISRYNVEAIDLLISANFVNLQQYDVFLAQLIENASYSAAGFATKLLQTYFIDERQNPNVTDADFANTIEMLTRLAQHNNGPEALIQMLEMLRANHDPSIYLSDRAIQGPTSYIHSGMLQARSSADIDEPPGFAEKSEYLLKDWYTIYHTQGTVRDPIKSFSTFVNKMSIYGILKGDEALTRFFRHATQMCIDLTYRNLNDPNLAPAVAKSKVFQWIDSYVRLIALLVKHSGETSNSTTKLNLLNKILGIVIGILLKDQEIHKTNFQQVGYHRIFMMLFQELSAQDPVLENIMVNVLTAFCHTYHILRPAAAPGFCYSWLELISHRIFLQRILAATPQQKGWSMYSQLLVDLFKYLAPFLRNAELAKPVTLLYKGTLRVLLVLLHDFPEFLCDYHFGFCDVIPPNCIQMRNLILSAYPRNMRLPDPFTPNLKVDMLSDISTTPRIYTNYAAAIQPVNFKKDLDSYLKQRSPVTFLAEIRGHLQISNEPGSRYNIPLMNALVLYVGTQAINQIRSKNLVPNMTTIVHNAHMDILQNLAVDLDNEGRYLFLNAIANQLRYPNIHTHYFSCALLYLFDEANSEAIQEQITRVLLERLIVNRPHPWGLLITFIELIKNPSYKFWDHDFVHCAPEIEKLFESVARSCMVKTQPQAQPQSNSQNSETEIAEC